jgi:hypothetical protein
MKKTDHLWRGTILAIATAGMLRILALPLPIMTMAAALLLFYMLQVMDEEFGRGVEKVAQWTWILVKTAVAFAGFVVTIFLSGQVFGIYPIDAFTDWGSSRGFRGVFWGHQAPRAIILEVLICIFIGWLVWSCSRGNGLAKLVACAYALILIAGLLFPEWSSIWPERRHAVGMELRNDGFMNTVHAAFAGDESALGYNNGHCPTDITNGNFSYDSRSIITIHLQTGCFYGPYIVPADADVIEITHSNNPGDVAAIWCVGRISPSPLRHANEDFTRDDISCPVPGQSNAFYAIGIGNLTIRVLTRKSSSLSLTPQAPPTNRSPKPKIPTRTPILVGADGTSAELVQVGGVFLSSKQKSGL